MMIFDPGSSEKLRKPAFFRRIRQGFAIGPPSEAATVGQCVGFFLKRELDTDARRPRENRMRVDALHPVRRFAEQT